jgi:hypothetical protein
MQPDRPQEIVAPHSAAVGAQARPPDAKPPHGIGAGFRTGLVFALALGAAFVWTNLDDLQLNFQMDGQVPEYLTWATSPDTFGASLNPELNQRLYSFYYAGLGQLARVMTRMNLLRLVYAAEILAVAAAVYFFVVVLTRDRWAALLAVAAAVWYDATAVALGGGGGMGLICGAEYPATALLLVALALSWRRAHVAAALVAGLAFNLHGSSALFVSVMVLFAAWVDGKWRIMGTRLIPAGLVCLGAASPTLIWILQDQAPAATMSAVDWLRFPRWIYPHHMFVSAAPLKAWATLFVFVLPGVLGLASRRREMRTQMRTLQGWIIAAAALLAIGTVFVEWIPVRQIAQFAFWRGTRFLVFLCLAFGLSYLVRCIRDGGFMAVAAALTMVAYVTPRSPELAWIGHLGLVGLLLATAKRARGFDRALTVAVTMAACAVVVCEASALSRLGEYLYWRWPVAVFGLAALFFWASRSRSWHRQGVALCASVVVVIWLTQVGGIWRVRSEYRRRSAALLDLAPTIEEACPPRQIVVAPPDLRNPGAWAKRGSFLCRQQLTAYGYGPWLAEEIINRMQWYVDTPIEQLPTDGSIVKRLTEGYRSRTSEQFADLRRRYGVRLAVVEHDQPLAFESVAENDLFIVYDLNQPIP